MKLYATVTSERATKGQGGNKYICIKLTVQNGTKQDYPIGEIILDYNDDNKEHGASQNEWVLKYLAYSKFDPEIIDRGNIEPPKNENKKHVLMTRGANYHPRARYIDCAPVNKDNCRICGWTDSSHNKTKGEKQKGDCEHIKKNGPYFTGTCPICTS